MCDTLSKNIGGALLALGDYANFVTGNELRQIAYSRLAYHLDEMRDSENNQRIKMLEFDLPSNVNEVDLSALATDIHTVQFVEMRVDQYFNSWQEWTTVPTVGIEALSDYQSRGSLACGFYATDLSEPLKIKFSYYGSTLQGVPHRQHRLYYDADIVLPTVLTSPSLMPNNLEHLLTEEITQYVIPFAKLRMTDKLADDETLPLALANLEQIRQDAMYRAMQWQERLDDFNANANRSQRGMNRQRYLTNRRRY